MPEIIRFPVAALRPTQDWIVPERVARAKLDARPIEVWPDLSIADGHHRWTWAKQQGEISIAGVWRQWPNTPRVKVRGRYRVDAAQSRR